MRRVVIIGGGNGSAVVINALKPFHEQLALSAVISMSDSGGSSGILRREFGVLPPGDLLRAALAMSPHDYTLLRDIFNKTRFHDAGKLNNHNLGNLFLSLATKYDGSMVHAIRALEEVVNAVGHAYPVTEEPSDLCVSLTDGTIVMGEHEIDRPTYDRSKKIVRSWLQPTPMIYEESKKVIEEADVILLGPGSMYASIAATLLVEGMAEALRASKAKIYFILGNSYEAGGETGPETVAEAVAVVQTLLPRPLAGVILNTSPAVAAYKDGERTLYQDDSAALTGVEMIKEDLGTVEGLTDPEKLGSLLKKMLEI